MPIAYVTEDRLAVSSPLKSRDLRKVSREVRVAQFAAPLTDADHQVLSHWINGRPEVTVRLYGGGATNLDFLRWYPTLAGFTVDCAGAFTSVDGLRYLPDQLKTLGLGIAIPAGADLQPLAHLQQLEHLSLSHHRRLPAFLSELPGLRSLHLEGPVRDVDLLAELPALRQLTLRSVTANLSPLTALHTLERLELKLGGCNDLRLIPEIGQLTYLELWRVKGLVNLNFLSELEQLEELFLQELRGITRLPDLARCRALRTLWLWQMKGLHDLAPLATAPALKHLRLVDAGHLTEADLSALTNLKLDELSIGLGSKRKNSAARQMLRIPGNYGGLPFP